MKTFQIKCYELLNIGTQKIEMVKDATILSVKKKVNLDSIVDSVLNDSIELYVLCNKDETEKETRTFRIYFVGDIIPGDKPIVAIGIVPMANMQFHLFEEVKPAGCWYYSTRERYGLDCGNVAFTDVKTHVCKKCWSTYNDQSDQLKKDTDKKRYRG